MEELEVKPLSNSGVELNSHVVVVDDGSGEFAVIKVGRSKVRLDVGEERENESVHVESDNQSLPVSGDQRGVNDSVVRSDGVSGVRDNPCAHSVNVVRQKVTSGSLLSIANLGRKSHVEHNLSNNPGDISESGRLRVVRRVLDSEGSGTEIVERNKNLNKGSVKVEKRDVDENDEHWADGDDSTASNDTEPCSGVEATPGRVHVLVCSLLLADSGDDGAVCGFGRFSLAVGYGALGSWRL